MARTDGDDTNHPEKWLIEWHVRSLPFRETGGTPRWSLPQLPSRGKVTDPAGRVKRWKSKRAVKWLNTPIQGLVIAPAPLRLIAHFVPNTPTGATSAGVHQVEERFLGPQEHAEAHDVSIPSG